MSWSQVQPRPGLLASPDGRPTESSAPDHPIDKLGSHVGTGMNLIPWE